MLPVNRSVVNAGQPLRVSGLSRLIDQLNSSELFFRALGEAVVGGHVRLCMIDVAGGPGRVGGIGSASWGDDSRGGSGSLRGMWQLVVLRDESRSLPEAASLSLRPDGRRHDGFRYRGLKAAA
jgi:hypothetical protein